MMSVVYASLLTAARLEFTDCVDRWVEANRDRVCVEAWVGSDESGKSGIEIDFESGRRLIMKLKLIEPKSRRKRTDRGD